MGGFGIMAMATQRTKFLGVPDMIIENLEI